MSRTCLAPRMALYLAPTGLVYACCSTRFPLGSIHESSLVEIWAGTRRQDQMARVEAGNLTMGCETCDRRPGEWTQASTFDDRVKGPLSGYPEYIDFALSNHCNLQCVMCDGDLSSSIRKHREHRAPLRNAYDDHFFEQLADFLPHAREVSFKGGEPFLAKETRRVWDLLIDLRLQPEVIVTTNGTTWNESVEHYLRALRMKVFISVDGLTAGTVESIRVGNDHAVLTANIARHRAVARDLGHRLTLNYCFLPQNWRELGAFIVAAQEAGDDVDILPVHYPPDYDVLRLPRSEVESILAALEAEGLQRGLTGTHAGWDEQLARLRSALDAEQARKGIPVDVVIQRRELRSDDSGLPADEALRVWGEGPPILLHLRESIVVAVDAPPTVPAVLRSVPWVGSYLDETFLDVVTDVLGPAEELTQYSGAGRDFDSVVQFAGDQGVREARAIGLPAVLRDGELVQEVLVAFRT